MALLLAACMVVVVTYCLARMVRPSFRDPAHHRDLDGWHALMGVAMAAMLVSTYSRVAALLALTVFVVGAGWSIIRLAAPDARAAYVRLGLGCAAMAAMLLPTATASAAAPLVMAPAMPMDHAAHQVRPTLIATAPLVPPTVLVMALLAAFAVILVIRLARTFGGGETVAGRLAACCDVAMAAAMGFMLVAFL